MKLNDIQSKTIYDFTMKYNSEEEFSKGVQELYNNEPGKLSILQIYALEEVLRYGTKNIYNKFIKVKGANTEEQAVSLFDGFLQLLSNDAEFKQYKTEQLQNAPETLSEIEIFVFELISQTKTTKEEEQVYGESTVELEYDSLNPILFSHDKQIRETLENLFLGEFIHKMMELPSMKPIRDRQKTKGQIANSDKKIIIEQIRGVVSTQASMSQLKQAIDQRYVKVKMDLLMGKGVEAFQQYLKFNTNITANEIFGIEKDTTVDDMYDYLKDMVNKRKTEGGTFSQADAMNVINKMKEKEKGPRKK